jgi:hypothetical protein
MRTSIVSMLLCQPETRTEGRVSWLTYDKPSNGQKIPKAFVRSSDRSIPMRVTIGVGTDGATTDPSLLSELSYTRFYMVSGTRSMWISSIKAETNFCQ